jgi:hypothetical protein
VRVSDRLRSRLRGPTSRVPVRAADPSRIAVEGVFAKRSWLPAGKSCAVVFTVDDVHPATSRDAYEAGGDRDKGALRHIAWLLERHPELHVTLFVTPDWRQISPFPTRRLLARIPVVNERVRLAPVLPKGTMRLDRHPEFVAWLRSLPRTDFAPHGLHHCHVGPRIGTEFQEQSREEIGQMLHEAEGIFRSAGLPMVHGHQPPLWHVSEPFLEACHDVGLRWIAAGRDLFTPPSDDATAAMNGPKGVSMMHPTLLPAHRLVHVTTNFQATSDVDRAFAILDQGGVLAIKAHVVKRLGAYVALDGLDEAYRAYLDAALRLIKERYRDAVLFTTVDDVAQRALAMGEWNHARSGGK